MGGDNFLILQGVDEMRVRKVSVTLRWKLSFSHELEIFLCLGSVGHLSAVHIDHRAVSSDDVPHEIEILRGGFGCW